MKKGTAQKIWQSLQEVFSRPRYLVLACIIALVTFTGSLWLQNWRGILIFTINPSIPLAQKALFLLHLLGGISTSVTLLGAMLIIAISFLFAINTVMLIFFLRRKIAQVQQSGMATGFLGIISGVLGMGCAACGSFLLTSVLSLFGASAILTYLPLRGEEFGILGVILLLFSIYLTAQQIQNPVVCRIDD
jgi:hypothetical protein